MHKYSDELINAYINGEEIVDYSIDELEDDYLFMMQVITKSRDKKIYNLCSNNVKMNYEFVKFLINTFKNDLEYVSKVAEFYIAKEKNEIQRLEIILIMCNLTQKKDNHKFTFYKLLAEARFGEEMFQIEFFKHTNETSIELINQIGMGFILVQEEYEGIEIIMNYFAHRFIEEIIWVYNLTLEKIIHSRFDEFSDFENYGITKYLIEYFSKYDYYLSEYLAIHTNVLDFLLEQIKSIKKSWSFFEQKNEKERFELILDSIHEYMCIYESECSFTEIEILLHMGKKFNIESELRKYDFLDEEIYKLLEENRNLDESIFSINDIKHYTYIKRLIQTVLSHKIARAPLEEELIPEEQLNQTTTKKSPVRCRIVKFPGI